MLTYKKLVEHAKAPTCSHPGEDLGFDIYALEDVEVNPFSVTKVRTGISVQYSCLSDERGRYGLLIKDRSSMSASGLFTVGGVIDSSYTGEILVMFKNVGTAIIDIRAGDKIAQLLPIKVFTQDPITEVSELPRQSRGDKGFGSTN